MLGKVLPTILCIESNNALEVDISLCSPANNLSFCSNRIPIFNLLLFTLYCVALDMALAVILADVLDVFSIDSTTNLSPSVIVFDELLSVSSSISNSERSSKSPHALNLLSSLSYLSLL